MKIEFTKMNGLGNSFILVSKMDDYLMDASNLELLAKQICCVNFGIGADGLVLVIKAHEKNYDFEMKIINSDGSTAQMCGNAIRCLARHVLESGMSSQKKLRILTGAGIIETEIKNDLTVKVNMGKPIFNNNDVAAEQSKGLLTVNIEQKDYSFVSMGNPHAVTFVDDFFASWPQLGEKIENHPLFPNRTNVEFVRIDSPNSVTMKVWERGCGETMACGTGACATVVAGTAKGLLKEKAITVHLPGGDLLIEYTLGNEVYMTGPASTVCNGTYFLPEMIKKQ